MWVQDIDFKDIHSSKLLFFVWSSCSPFRWGQSYQYLRIHFPHQAFADFCKNSCNLLSILSFDICCKHISTLIFHQHFRAYANLLWWAPLFLLVSSVLKFVYKHVSICFSSHLLLLAGYTIVSLLQNCHN